mmetsp:Transcript_10480/g.64134  ORF Transcript_10480/g.64134 Transcript_10480/m.64134 type:complete len:359 (-) Transcript_10480:3875-4951(-)
MGSKPDALPASWRPFRRTDAHGGRWWPSDAWQLCVQQAVGMAVWAPWRACLALLGTLCFAAICAATIPPPGSTRVANLGTKKVVARLGRASARFVLWTMGVVRIHVTDVPWDDGRDDGLMPWKPSRANEPSPCALWVSNHVSFVDVLVHMAMHFPSFVSREETGRTPLVGGIARAMDCVFVRREKDSMVGSDESGIVRGSEELARRAALRDRLVKDRASDVDVRVPPVVVFAEGTTSNGEQLLTFRTGAFLSNRWIRPVVLRYRPLWWASFSLAWESISALQHVVLMFSQGGYAVDVLRMPPCAPKPGTSMDPAAFSRAVRARMSASSGLPCVSATFADKRAYHAHLAIPSATHVKRD